jgi:hypothetical protein
MLVSYVRISFTRSVVMLCDDCYPTPSSTPTQNRAAPAGLSDLLQAIQAPVFIVKNQSLMRIPSADPEGRIRDEVLARVYVPGPRMNRYFFTPAHAYWLQGGALQEQACANTQVLEVT